jgi:hypothetical protein
LGRQNATLNAAENCIGMDNQLTSIRDKGFLLLLLVA